jgi:hypothetical protein
MLSRLLAHLTNKRRPDPQAFVVCDIQYLAEQDGPIEQALKAEWRRVLQQLSVPSAYLVRVQLPELPTSSVALMLSKGPLDDAKVVAALMPSFKNAMAGSQFVDIVFMTQQQEAEVAKVCKPFWHAA